MWIIEMDFFPFLFRYLITYKGLLIDDWSIMYSGDVELFFFLKHVHLCTSTPEAPSGCCVWAVSICLFLMRGIQGALQTPSILNPLSA